MATKAISGAFKGEAGVIIRGIVDYERRGIVEKLVEGGQAQQQGVTEGMRLSKIGDSAYDFDDFKKAIDSGEEYTLTFVEVFWPEECLKFCLRGKETEVPKASDPEAAKAFAEKCFADCEPYLVADLYNELPENIRREKDPQKKFPGDGKAEDSITDKAFIQMCYDKCKDFYIPELYQSCPDEFRDDMAFTLEFMKKGRSRLSGVTKAFPDHLKQDEAFQQKVKEIVEEEFENCCDFDVSSLYTESPDFLKDKAFALRCFEKSESGKYVKGKFALFTSFPQEWQEDEPFVQACYEKLDFSNVRQFYQVCHEKFRNDKAFALKCLGKSAAPEKVYQSLPSELANDKAFAEQCISTCSRNINELYKALPEEFRGDEALQQKVKEKYTAFLGESDETGLSSLCANAPECVKADKAVQQKVTEKYTAMIESSGVSLYVNAPEALKGDKAFAKQFLEKCGHPNDFDTLYKAFPDEIARDEAVVNEIMEKSSGNTTLGLYKLIPEQMRSDKALTTRCATKCWNIYENMPESLDDFRSDKAFVEQVIQSCHVTQIRFLYKSFPDQIRSDEALALQCMKKCQEEYRSDLFEMFPKELKGNKAFALACFDSFSETGRNYKWDVDLFEKFSDDLRGDKALLLECLGKAKWKEVVGRAIPKQFFSDKAFALGCFTNCDGQSQIGLYKSLSEEICRDKAFVNQIIDKCDAGAIYDLYGAFPEEITNDKVFQEQITVKAQEFITSPHCYVPRYYAGWPEVIKGDKAFAWACFENEINSDYGHPDEVFKEFPDDLRCDKAFVLQCYEKATVSVKKKIYELVPEKLRGDKAFGEGSMERGKDMGKGKEVEAGGYVGS